MTLTQWARGTVRLCGEKRKFWIVMLAAGGRPASGKVDSMRPASALKIGTLLSLSSQAAVTRLQIASNTRPETLDFIVMSDSFVVFDSLLLSILGQRPPSPFAAVSHR